VVQVGYSVFFRNFCVKSLPHIEELVVAELFRNSPYYIEPGGALPSSQKPATRPRPESVEPCARCPLPNIPDGPVAVKSEELSAVFQCDCAGHPYVTAV